MTTGYLLAGLPGSGKSTVASVLSDITGGTVIYGGDIIREAAKERGIENPSSHDLGQVGAQLRDEEGGGVFGKRAVEMLERGEYDPIDSPAIVDSVRHIDGAREFMEYFDQTNLMWVTAPRDTRFNRLVERGRDDEDEFSWADMCERDNRELKELGQQTIFDSPDLDFVVSNGGTRDNLWNMLQDMLNE